MAKGGKGDAKSSLGADGTISPASASVREPPASARGVPLLVEAPALPSAVPTTATRRAASDGGPERKSGKKKKKEGKEGKKLTPVRPPSPLAVGTPVGKTLTAGETKVTPHRASPETAAAALPGSPQPTGVAVATPEGKARRPSRAPPLSPRSSAPVQTDKAVAGPSSPRPASATALFSARAVAATSARRALQPSSPRSPRAAEGAPSSRSGSSSARRRKPSAASSNAAEGAAAGASSGLAGAGASVAGSLSWGASDASAFDDDVLAPLPSHPPSSSLAPPPFVMRKPTASSGSPGLLGLRGDGAPAPHVPASPYSSSGPLPYSGPLVVPQTPTAWQAAKTNELGDIFYKGIHQMLQADDQWTAVRKRILSAC